MNIRSYIEILKPRIVLLLVFTAVAAMIVAYRLNHVPFTVDVVLPAVLAIAAGCAGCNAVTCYVDRDIDAIMTRTLGRPLPSKRIDPPQKALLLGLALITLSLVLTLVRNLLSFVFMALGIMDNVVVYSLLLKRRSALNILAGGVSGGLPLVSGWAYVANNVTLLAALMAALVVVWIPNHIWSLAIKYKEDYERAKVPMMPVIVEEKTAVRFTVFTSILLVTFSILLFFFDAFGFIYLLTAVTLGFVMLFLNLWLFVKPTKKMSWVVFKFSSPYLAILFLAMIVGVALR